MTLKINNNIMTKIDYNILNHDPKDELLEELSLTICEYLSIDPKDDILALIKNLTNIVDKTFVAIALLRFYRHHDQIIEGDKILKRELIQLFNEVFQNTIYPRENINDKTPSHEKLPSLVKYLNRIETINIQIASLTKLNIFKQTFYKLVNGEYKNIITPFLDQNIYINIEQTFITIEDYIKEPSEDSYSIVVSHLNEIISTLQKAHTEYNDKFLLNPLMKICQLIETNFKKTPASMQSKLVISSNEKNYPLLSPIGESFKFLVQLKNIEKGKAFNTNIKLVNISDNVYIEDCEQFVGKIEGNQIVNIDFDAKILKHEESFKIRVEVNWENYNKSKSFESKELILHKQRIDIDWKELENKSAYSIHAIEKEDQLIGRSDILNDLYKGLINNLDSYYIHGQKRVGKTSIANTIKAKLSKRDDFIVSYNLPSGTSLISAIQELGTNICKDIKRQFRQELKDIVLPVFIDNISPLEDFLDDVIYELGEKKFVFIIDEFDELSSGLYDRNDLSTAFFLSIRKFTSHPRLKCSFLLVGGERISFLMSIHGQYLNFFKEHRVDYFDKEHFNQFKELVKKPVENYLDISDKAIELIYNETSGNPYFTNFICKEMLNTSIEKRDNHITDKEMSEAIEKAIKQAPTHIFIHFWDDGIRELNIRKEEITYKRRNILITLSSLMNLNKELKQTYIIDELVSEFNRNEIIRLLKEFVDRKILIEKDRIYSFRINFFKDWLKIYASERILMTLTNEQEIQRYAKEESDAKIDAKEIKDFIKSKNIIYNGVPLTTDDVRSWLEQFGDNLKQRLIFKILENITYYRTSNIKDKMKLIFESIKKERIIASEGRKINHVLVSYLRISENLVT